MADRPRPSVLRVHRAEPGLPRHASSRRWIRTRSSRRPLFPPIFTDRGPISPMATAVGGAVVGGAIAAGVMASKKVAENTAEAGAGEEG